MATDALRIGRYGEKDAREPVSKVLPLGDCIDGHVEENEMPRRTTGETFSYEEATTREIMHGMMLATTSLAKSMEAQTTQPKANGQRTTIIAALVLGMLPWAFNAVWWTRGTERDTASQVERHKERIDELTGELGSLRTWNEKLRNNMSAYGWLIDDEGNVSRIEEQRRPRARN